MNSDSESQDSDEGRRFRFETTRKDAVTLQRKDRISPPRNRRLDRRSRSRDRSSRDGRSRHSNSDSSRRKRTPNRDDSNGRDSYKKKSKKSDKDSKDSNSKRSDKDSSRSHHHSKNHESKDTKDYSNGSKETKEGKTHSATKHKSKSREKRKKRSRDRSHEKSDLVSDHKESLKKEYHKTTSNDSSTSVDTQDDDVKKRKKSKKSDRKHEARCGDSSSSKTIDSKTSISAGFPDSRVTKTPELNVTAPPRKVPKSFFDRVVNKRSREDDESTFGPALPPKLEKSLIIARESKKESFDDIEGTTPPRPVTKCDESLIGPALPGNSRTIVQKDDGDSLDKKKEINDGRMSPRTPPRINKIESINEEKREDDSFGPILPPQLKKNKIVGPMLPANFVIPDNTDEEMKNCQPCEESDDSDTEDHSFGPLPVDHPASQSSHVQIQLEQRARRVKEKFGVKESPEKNKREEWMTELPPAHAVALGLGSINRKFKTREGPDMSDRSIWTDTPADRLRKQKEKEENRFIPSEDSSIKATIESDPVQQDIEEKKAESLLDMHLKTMKRKKKKMEKEAKQLGLPTRRPFDRDVDLQTNRLDEARKKKIFEKASRLNDRFAVGKI